MGYWANLGRIGRDFLRPCVSLSCTPKSILTSLEIKNIFINIEIICLKHQQLLEKLTRSINKYNYFQTYSDIFLEMGSDLEHYTEFVSNYDKSRTVLRECLEKGALKKLESSVKKKLNIKLGLRDLLIMPVQKIPKWVLFIVFKVSVKFNFRFFKIYSSFEGNVLQDTLIPPRLWGSAKLNPKAGRVYFIDGHWSEIKGTSWDYQRQADWNKDHHRSWKKTHPRWDDEIFNHISK